MHPTASWKQPNRDTSSEAEMFWNRASPSPLQPPPPPNGSPQFSHSFVAHFCEAKNLVRETYNESKNPLLWYCCCCCCCNCWWWWWFVVIAVVAAAAAVVVVAVVAVGGGVMARILKSNHGGCGVRAYITCTCTQMHSIPNVVILHFCDIQKKLPVPTSPTLS